MISQRIRDRNGKPIAYIMDKGNGVQSIQTVNGAILGWYRPSASGGRTTDPNGRILSQGNTLTSLVAKLL